MKSVLEAFGGERRWFAVACLCVAGALLASIWNGGAAAQEPPEPAAVAARFAEWNQALDRLGHDVNTLKLDATQIEAFSAQAADIRGQASAFGDEIQHFVDEARELRDAFVASAPAGAAESADAQAQGKALQDRVALYEGWTRQTDLTVARADQLQDKISAKRLNQLASSLTERGPVPLNPLAWWRGAEEALGMTGLAAASVTDEARSWREPGSETGQAAMTTLAAAAAAWLAAFFAVRVAARRRWPVLEPTLSGPASRVFLAILADAGPWVAAVAAGWLAAPLKDWLPEAPGRVVIAALIAAALTVAVGVWIVRAALVRPPAGVPSLVAKDMDRATLARAVVFLIVLSAIDGAVQRLTAAFVSANLLAVWTLAFTVAGSLAARSATRVVGRALVQHGAADSKLTRLLLLVLPAAVATVSVIATALGYAELGSYIFSNSLATAAVLFLAWGLRNLAQEIVVAVCDAGSPAGRLLHDRLGADQPALRLAQFWLGIAFDFAVVVAMALALMVVWGTGTEDALLMVERLVEGVRVGNVTLSLTDLLAAMITFAVGVWLTRLSQKVLDRRVFPGTQLDLGVRNSLRSGLGYIGVIIAGAIAVLALGINLSSLALVAGALSVGIGFGLQHIINNFVSGLILLIERPVKVGDWITVGSNEGMVNRINVRSTEIITDDRASVLIPNADFLSVSVTNWTLKDKGARMHLTFRLPESLGASGGRDLLLACAKANPNVLRNPPPRVLLQDIGGGYSFELAADVADVTTMKEVASDLRFAVDRELQKVDA